MMHNWWYSDEKNWENSDKVQTQLVLHMKIYYRLKFILKSLCYLQIQKHAYWHKNPRFSLFTYKYFLDTVIICAAFPINN